ncbi:MAG: tetratricopeptide repeat protein [Kofleriaceae bacterium]
MQRLLILAVVLGVVGTASAQSKRYPPEPVDKDEEAADKSGLWERATNPHRSPYQALIAEARELMKTGAIDAADAVKKLDQAVRLLPEETEAYRVRGEAWMALKEWTKCAADHQFALARQKPADDARVLAELRLRLGICLARAGKLADAERTLADAAAAGTTAGEVWMRLGEVRIAMGKLEEAIAALEVAAESGDVQAIVRWLLAGAYDRARRPSEALTAARAALERDRGFGTLTSAATPLLGKGEAEYLKGLGYAAYDPPRPEYALVYFRLFLKLAPDSPWRRRAEDHLKEARTATLPEVVERRTGNATLDVTVARTAVRRSMPAMRACLAKLPSTILLVEITKVGPRSAPASAPGRSRYFAPPEGVTVSGTDNLDATAVPTRAEVDAAIRCIEPIASQIKLPAVKDKDAYYKASFSVVGP